MNDGTAVPADFPRKPMLAVVPGAQAKVCVVLSDGQYIAGQTDEERYARWQLCENLAQQLVTVALQDRAEHPQHTTDLTLERVRVSVSQTGGFGLMS